MTSDKIIKEIYTDKTCHREEKQVDVELLICMEEVAPHPRLMQIRGNLTVKSDDCVAQQ